MLMMVVIMKLTHKMIILIIIIIIIIHQQQSNINARIDFITVHFGGIVAINCVKGSTNFQIHKIIDLPKAVIPIIKTY